MPRKPTRKKKFRQTLPGMLLALVKYSAIVAWHALRGLARRLSRRSGFLPIAIGGGAAALIAVVLIARGMTAKNAHEVLFQGEPVGVVKIVKNDLLGEDYAAYVAELAQTKLAAAAGAPVRVNETVASRETRAKAAEMVTLDAVLSALEDKYTYDIAACVIAVNGQTIAVVDTAAAAEEALERLKKLYYPEGFAVTRADFVEDVTAEMGFVPPGSMVSGDVAFAALSANARAGETYVVQSGDSLGKIAGNADMTLDELLAVNPGYTASTVIHVGEVLNLVVAKPLISVRTYEQVTYEEWAPKTVDTVYNDKQPKSYSKVLQQGRDGRVSVTAEVVRINGLEQPDKVVLSRTVIEEPLTEIVEVGTK